MKQLSKRLAVIWLLMPVLTFAHDDFRYQRDFSPEEFAQRRAKVFEEIGPEVVALLQGAPAPRYVEGEEGGAWRQIKTLAAAHQVSESNRFVTWEQVFERQNLKNQQPDFLKPPSPQSGPFYASGGKRKYYIPKQQHTVN